MQTHQSNIDAVAKIGEISRLMIMVKSVADHYGYNPQSRQLIEEMAELTQAINKFWRKNMRCGELEAKYVPLSGAAYDNIVEEIADVEILLEQVKYLLQISGEDIIKNKIGKMERQVAKIEDGISGVHVSVSNASEQETMVKMMDDFREAVHPLHKWLCKYGHPHMKVVVEQDRAHVDEGKIGITLQVPD